MAKVDSQKKTSNRIYNIWCMMKKRCHNPNAHAYERYGGRGIGVCQEWQTFEGFFADMSIGYSDMLTLDRKDNELGYSKENCRWATMKEQQNNRRNNFRVKGKTFTEWSEVLGIKRSTLAQRYYVYKWPIEKVLTKRV